MKGKGMNGLYGNGDGNDIPRREAFEWYAKEEGVGVATWYANTGIWWTKRNNQPNDGISVEEQKGDPQSLFNHYRKMLKLRAAHEALSSGAYAQVENNNDFIFSFLRKTDSKTVLVAANMSDQNQKVVLKEAKRKFKAIYGQVQINDNAFELKPYEVVVWGVK
jgi:glycosidase